ncbi:aspartyl protease family protein [Flammeovirga sp. EKP202]|uniref:aspartyl protease family protein n=1 Tax=Flammeovirga sp. EKP202 TaxID=2770592 RepID=UPI00165F7308|nr:aspartyl protease family protein [Flammeovirga sp. EKP202]MBD0405383.1 aspartyl protease family protein [Flammeovirga sp. EKP202]
MSTKKTTLFFLVSLLLLIFKPLNILAQNKAEAHLKNLAFTHARQDFTQIKFKLVNNLVVIPMVINDSDTLNFILDSGASYIILCDPLFAKKLNLPPQKTREVDIKGMGTDGALRAYHSWGNKINLKGIEGFNQDIIYPSEDIFKLSDTMGMLIHGLIGSTVFNHFVVSIDYKRRLLTLYKKDFYYTKRRDRFKKRYESIPLTVRKNRAYIESALLTSETNKTHKVSLLVDTGASHALSIFESHHHNLRASVKAIRDHLGVGISGDLYGKVNRLEKLSLGSFTLDDPIVKYPDYESIGMKVVDSTRHGSIGAEVLRRFTVIFDYEKEEMLIRKNTDFKDDFLYNYLGLEFTTPYPGLPFFRISQIREQSPAYKAGMQQGHRILKVNGQSVAFLTPEEIRILFRGKIGQKISIAVEDLEGRNKTFSLRLEDPFRQN